MLMPSIIAENLFDDWFDFPSFRNMDRQLYGRHFAREMKTDVHEHDDHYEVDIDLPPSRPRKRSRRIRRRRARPYVRSVTTERCSGASMWAMR